MGALSISQEGKENNSRILLPLGCIVAGDYLRVVNQRTDDRVLPSRQRRDCPEQMPKANIPIQRWRNYEDYTTSLNPAFDCPFLLLWMFVSRAEKGRIPGKG